MKNLAEVLLQLAPAIDQIASVSGVPGMSIGVFHEGDVVFHYNYGHRDLSAKLPTTSSTIYPIGSLSKAFMAFACGALVDDGVLEWDTPIRSILPESQSTSPEVQALASPRDLLSHRTGIPGGESLYFHAQPLLNDSAIVPTFGALPPVLPFRDQMFYNNLGYGLLALAMTSRSGLSYEDLIRAKITGPLKLQQTGLNFTDPRQTAKLAKTYLVTETTEPIENKRPQFAPGSSMAASGGIRSSVDDLLIFYREVLKQLSPHIGLKSTPVPSFSLKELKAIMSTQTFIKNTENTIM